MRHVTSSRWLAALALVIVAFVLAGCSLQLTDFTIETGPTVTETQTVQTLGAQAAEANISMGVGRLLMGGGATDLMSATFSYNVPTWKPEVEYQINGNRGSLRVAQPGGDDLRIPSSADVEYEWDIRLSNSIPMALNVDMGVGEGDLSLRGLNLTDLDVATGVGSSTIDLGGPWNQSFDVSVQRGVGKTTIIVPTQVGVQLKPRQGLGNIRVYGLVQNGDVYHNSQYGVSPVTINIEIFGGVGDTEVRLDQ